MGAEILVVEDARKDPRFAENPLVTSAPDIRFYAGAPLIDGQGQGLGSLCVIDRQPRVMKHEQLHALEALARQVISQIEVRAVSSQLAAALAEVKTLSGMLPICAHCKNIRNDKGYWTAVENYIGAHTEAEFSHGICPSCMDFHFPDLSGGLT